MKRLSVLLALITLVSLNAFCEDEITIEDIVKFLEDKALSVHMSARLIDQDEESVWDATSKSITIAGRAIKVWFVGKSFFINAYITPFGNIEDKLLLVAYGELWMSGRNGVGLKYESFLKSLPVDPGERAIFFPLGVAVDAQENIYTIELEIQILPFRDDDLSNKDESTTNF